MKNDELDFFKTKTFHSLRDTVEKRRRENLRLGANIHKPHICLRTHISGALKNSQNLIIQKEPNSKRKAKDLKRHFTEKDVQWQVNTQKS